MRSWWFDLSRGYFTGLLARAPKRDGIRVFCYHGVVESKTDARLERNFHLLSDFRAHIRFLKSFRILGLSELASELSNPPRRQRCAAVITFDDGYANNMLAAELLADARLPWSIFVSTGAIGRENAIWTVELSLLLLHGHAEQIEVLDRCWSLRERAEREHAFQIVRTAMKLMPAETRKDTMAIIRQQFPQGELRRLLSEFRSMQMLSWDEIRQLASAGVEVGSHGVDHEIHHPWQPVSVRLHELQKSKSDIEEQLNRACAFFAFPNGGLTPSSPDEVASAGYQLAFTTQQDCVRDGCNRYALPRLGPPGSIRTFVDRFFWEPISNCK